MHNLCRLRAFAGQTLIRGWAFRYEWMARRVVKNPKMGLLEGAVGGIDFGAHVCILRRMHDPKSIRRSTTRAHYFK